MRKQLLELAFGMRRGRGKLSIKRTSMRPEATRTKVKERNAISLRLRVRRGLIRIPIIKYNRRYSFLILLNLRKRISQTWHTIIKKRP
jgi:hypothetical protein